MVGYRSLYAERDPLIVSTPEHFDNDGFNSPSTLAAQSLSNCRSSSCLLNQWVGSLKQLSRTLFCHHLLLVSLLLVNSCSWSIKCFESCFSQRSAAFCQCLIQLCCCHRKSDSSCGIAPWGDNAWRYHPCPLALCNGLVGLNTFA